MTNQRNVAETLAKPDIHKEWVSNYRNAEADQFTADSTAVLLERAGLPEGATVLDAGCGSGTHSMRLAQAGFKVTAADFSEFILAKAKEDAAEAGLADRITFQQADLTRLPFKDQAFQAVYCHGVLMHIPALEAALGELVRVLKPGGKLILSETNEQSLEMRAFRLYWRLHRRKVKVERKPSGTEAWAETAAGPLLSRKLNAGWLIKDLDDRGLTCETRISGELTELYNYFGSARMKSFFHRMNRWWFRRLGGAGVATGNLFIFLKRQ